MNPTTLLSSATVLITTVWTAGQMLLVIGVLALIAGRIPQKLSLSRKRGWVIAHIIFVVILFSGLIGGLFLVLMTTFVPAGQLIYAAHFFIVYFGILASAGTLGAVFTGTWLAARTNWGLTKHAWVITKWVGLLVVTALGTPILAIGQTDSLFETFHGTINPLQNPAYLHYREMYFVGIALQLTVLFSLLFITILKPWGKRQEA